MRQNIILILLILFQVYDVRAESARLIVIVNSESAIARMEIDEVRRIFLGKPPLAGSFPLLPVNLQSSNRLRELFDRLVLGKSPRHIRSYWVEKIFTGRGLPPQELADSDAVVDFVAKHIDAIGYIEETKLVPQVKNVLTIP